MHAAATITTLLSLFASTYAVSNLQGPTNAAPGSNVTATWSSGSSDTQTMTLALLSADTNVTYPGGLAVANTVVPGDNKATFLFPPTDPGTYKLVLYSSSNTSDVLATSGSFSVGAAAPATTASGSTAPPASSASSKPATSSGSVSHSVTAPIASITSSAAAAASSIASGAVSQISSVVSVASAGASSVAVSAASAASVSAASAASAASASASGARPSSSSNAAVPTHAGSGMGLAAFVLGLFML